MKKINKKLKIRVIAIALGVVFMLPSGCKKQDEIPPIELPETSVLSIQSSWGVVNTTHLRLREGPSTRNKAVTTLWKGSVVEILTKTEEEEEVEGNTDFWYQINFGGLTGWVFGSYLEIHSSKEKAEEVSEELK